MNKNNLVSDEIIIHQIFEIRGQKVMLDSDLAQLYGVQTKVLKQAVKRNINRFPEDFMFQLDKKELENLRSQFVTSSWGGSRYLPMAFTESGVTMLACVLNSNRAIEMNIKIIRIFVKLRQTLLVHKDILLKIEKIERQTEGQGHEIKILFEYLKKLMIDKVKREQQETRRRIGYKKED